MPAPIPRHRFRYGSAELDLGEDLLAPWFEKHPSKKSALLAPGYWATYGVPDGLLTIMDLSVADARNLRTGLRSVTGDVWPEPDDRVMTWLSRLLVLPQGRGCTVLEIRKGRLTAERGFDEAGFHKFKEEQFEYFCLTDDYEALKAAARLDFERLEQEARRKDAGRGYRTFDSAAFDRSVAGNILLHCRELLAD
ncbi:hypothetical protein [Flaviaesturariibacter amylovorans]|uniref:Uncharacterized protein n=1 Tax=Flaviaesturariibacter amylovorans TaxID=1084520 RepID=A0ABP8GDM4_9BACT